MSNIDKKTFKMEILKLPIYLYAGIKKYLTVMKFHRNLIIPLSLFVTLILTPIFFNVYLVLALLKYLVNLILLQVWEENYRGMMEGIESVFMCCTNCVLLMVTFVEFHGEIKEMKELVEQQIAKTMQTKHEKLFYFRGNLFGYNYLYKSHLKPEDYIVIMEKTDEEVLTRKEFVTKLSLYDQTPLPLNNRGLFQVLICPQPVKLEKDPENKNIYAIIYRLHHVIGDGRSLIHLFKGVFADAVEIDEKTVVTPPVENKISVEGILDFISGVRIKDLPFSQCDQNILRGYNLSEDKCFVWFSDSSSKYLGKIKKLRRTLKGITFLDIINTCLGSSLCDYYQKHSPDADIPETVIGGVVLSAGVANYSSYGRENFILENKFSAASLNIPINISTEGNNKLIGRLKYTQKDYEKLRKSFDVQFSYWITQNICNVIPQPIIKFLSTQVQITVGISSIPGCDKFTFFGGYEVKDYILLPPNSPGTGLHIIIYTYNGYLRICFTADKSVIPIYEDAQEIVDTMIKYLDQLSDLFEIDSETTT